MIAIHSIHRRMAELFMISKRRDLTYSEALEMQHCIEVNANLVVAMDSLKTLSMLAYEQNDTEWLHEIAKKIDGLEAQCI